MKKIEVNGTTLAYREFGSGNKYLISTQNFFLTGCHMELLGKPPYDYHVFLITMRGYGESEHIFDAEPKDYTKIWGEDVIFFAEAMGIPNFYYTGVSHGNWAGWYIAFHRPELLRGFVCCDGIAQFRGKSETRPAPPHSAVNWDETVGNPEALENLAWAEHWPTENLQRLERRRRNHEEHLEILMLRKKEEFLLANTNISACDAETEAEFYDFLAQIPVPMLLLGGALDPLSKVEDMLKIAKIIPGAQMLTYQHLGHGGPDECPEMIALNCDRFFKDAINFPGK